MPSRDGQGVLWGEPEDWDPPSELRVWRCWSSPQVTQFICPNESLSHDTLISRALERRAGELVEGWDTLDLEYIKGVYYTESLKAIIDGTETVMALVHLGKEQADL